MGEGETEEGEGERCIFTKWSPLSWAHFSVRWCRQLSIQVAYKLHYVTYKLTYLSPTMMCRLEAEVRDLQAALQAAEQEQRHCRT